ncbi:hypothetical protein MPTK1_1g06680 [Marchantia polymorpha subsp. ruderalis]|uniref:Uncharacterized protein n=2 Tax=Marchantia polymorpha TaxID=3197 RepID=A0AAF6AMA1_MARPO|nr:hypothetical protein MARPO_0043s0060 [Marchantia polymorpha]BBM97571.1 hypothetical protein Mp_1g06680 [Marchantia polymorpha subsp. ruderalis]|eukprot:PTQ39812.1 hypothetical protein MARPO_0043s0060 [Marchantia polymorpha]
MAAPSGHRHFEGPLAKRSHDLSSLTAFTKRCTRPNLDRPEEIRAFGRWVTLLDMGFGLPSRPAATKGSFDDSLQTTNLQICGSCQMDAGAGLPTHFRHSLVSHPNPGYHFEEKSMLQLIFHCLVPHPNRAYHVQEPENRKVQLSAQHSGAGGGSDGRGSKRTGALAICRRCSGRRTQGGSVTQHS